MSRYNVVIAGTRGEVEEVGSSKRLVLGIAVAVIVVQQAWILSPAIKRLVFPPREDAAVAGRRVAERLGCFSCHGPGGAGGIANPGGDKDVIPALAGGEMMMWADDENELREWILYGSPQDDDHREERSGYDAGQGTGRAIVMPAFEPHLAAGELPALIAFLKSVSGLQFPEEGKAEKGFELAYELGCFSCHGPMGVGGVVNPGSLKGYIPGFGGDDYAEIVASPEELHQWIENGISDRFSASVPARTIIDRQALKMPAYGQWLKAEQIESLVALVQWLADGNWRQIPVP